MQTEGRECAGHDDPRAESGRQAWQDLLDTLPHKSIKSRRRQGKKSKWQLAVDSPLLLPAQPAAPAPTDLIQGSELLLPRTRPRGAAEGRPPTLSRQGRVHAGGSRGALLGASICQHARRRSQCKDCGGAGVCQHNRQRSKCKECAGGASASTIASGANARRAKQQGRVHVAPCRRVSRIFKLHPNRLVARNKRVLASEIVTGPLSCVVSWVFTPSCSPDLSLSQSAKFKV